MKMTYTDQKHAYWLDGRRAKSASKVAQIMADRYALEQHMKRMVAVGMTIDPTLREKAAVDLENKDLLNEVCEDADRVAKSGARAARGTQRHRVLELTLLGQTEFITDQQRADNMVLQRTLDAYGLEPIKDRVEQFVAWPDHGVVGRYDAVLMHEGRPVLTDLKGGVNAILYPHTTLTQCALYLYAPHTSTSYQRDGDKTVVTEWTTMPDGIDTDVAYVIYCDDTHDVGELWRLDMAHGLAGATLALSIVDWRKKHRYGEQAVTQVAAPKIAGVGNSSPPTPAPSALDQAVFNVRRQALLNRYKALTPKRKTLFRERGLHPSDLDGITALLDELSHPPNMRELAAQVGAVRGGAA